MHLSAAIIPPVLSVIHSGNQDLRINVLLDSRAQSDRRL